MIKIIKDGKKEFTQICLTCGCEFSYELDDLKRGIAYSTVKCPCCGDDIIHSDAGKEYTHSATSNPIIRDNMVYETPEYRKLQNALKKQVKHPSYVECENHCSNCQFFRDYLSGKIYVGDSPCQWCQYSGLKVTCTSTGTSANGVK